MKRKQPSHFLSLIIPAYKQEKIIVKNILQLKKTLDRIRYDYEIIVVIDGTVDRSYERIKRAKITKTRCYEYDVNQGKSFAIRFGMKHAKGDYIMFIDSGMEIHPNGVSMLMEHIEWYGADIIVGSKRHPASQVIYSPMRRVLSLGYHLLVKILFGLKIRDTQAGIKIFKKKVIKRILPRLMEKKFAGDLEMLVVSRKLGFKRIFEAPIKLNYRLAKLTSAATFTSIRGMFLDTLAIFYRSHILHHYDKAHRKFVIPKDLKVKKINYKKK